MNIYTQSAAIKIPIREANYRPPTPLVYLRNNYVTISYMDGSKRCAPTSYSNEIYRR